MDGIDRAILRRLRAHGRLTNVELAQAVNLSPSPCLRRVKRLEDDGVIEGYRAEINLAAVDCGLEVRVAVTLSPETGETIRAFEDAVQSVDAIVECHRMVGEPDYLLRVLVADMETYERFYTNVLAGLPGVVTLTSQVAMKTVKNGSALPI